MLRLNMGAKDMAETIECLTDSYCKYYQMTIYPDYIKGEDRVFLVMREPTQDLVAFANS